jgi:hypothetical protein
VALTGNWNKTQLSKCFKAMDVSRTATWESYLTGMNTTSLTLRNVPRPAEVLIAWLENHRIEIDYTFDMDGDKAIELTRENDRAPLVSYPFGEGSLAEAINFCMDLMERKG